MPEPLGHNRHVDAGREHEGRLSVAQIVQPHPAQSGRVDQGTEQLGDVVRAQRVAVLPGEHQAVVGVRVAPRLALLTLAQLVREQRAHGALVQVDDSVLTGRGLGPAERHSEVARLAVRARRGGLVVLLAARLLDDLLPYDDDPGRKVNVVPSQAYGFTATQAGTRDRLEHGAEPVSPDGVEELPELPGLPRFHLRPLGYREVNVLGRVEGDQTPPYGR
ncbi:hypothetical protein OG741_19345 [Streptomyces sp. NBC_01410]